MEEKYSEYKLRKNQQFVKEVLIEKPVNTTIQIIYDKGIFDKYDSADEVMKI